MKKIINVYWAVIAITALFAILFKNDRKKFVTYTALVHVFVCGFRYDTMHGDLMVYKRGFNNFAQSSWTSEAILNGGKNTLFYVFNKIVASLTGNNFQALLLLIAALSVFAISLIIYRYSEKPFISYLMWSCFGFYMFGFYSIKQSMAMAFVMLSAIGIFEKKRLIFYLFAIIAGFVHMPAFVFMPAYELCRAKKMRTIIYFYIIFSLIVILFRNQIVSSMAELYYEGDKYAAVSSFEIGGKSLMLLGLVAVGIFLCSIKNEIFRYTLVLIATASLIQMFSVYDNVFTRLTDYYFQFIILYAPFILGQPYKNNTDAPIMPFNKESKDLITILFCLLAMMFYYRVHFVHASISPVDNLINNFKFFWQ